MQENDYKTATAVDLVDLLSSMGYNPQKISGPDHWYCSPLRNERTASFKVNRNRNVFFDHGTGTGGTVVRFVMLYFQCPANEAIRYLLKDISLISSTRQSLVPPMPANTIQVLDVQPLAAPALLRYLEERCIPTALAQNYCVQVHYRLKGKDYYAIGFKNDRGGYELRNKYFKGSSAPKAPRFFDQGKPGLVVFEGFFNFLSYLVLQKELSLPGGNFLVLNSLAFFNTVKEIMERHQNVHLCLDRDAAGMQCTAKAIATDKRFNDASQTYANDKDWNQWLVWHRAEQKAVQKRPVPLIKKHKGRRI